jgi:hypothetical protein
MPPVQQNCREALSGVRRKQFELAMKGNTGMLVWLGKQWLGQSEKHEVRGPDQGAIQHEVKVMDLSKLQVRRNGAMPR